MKNLLLILGILILGNTAFATQPDINLPKDAVIIQRKTTQPKQTETETKTEQKQEIKPEVKKEITFQSPLKKIEKENRKKPSNGIIIYDNNKSKTKTKPKTDDDLSCKDDPKSPCNIYKAKPAQVRKPRLAQPKKPRKKYPLQPRIDCD